MECRLIWLNSLELYTAHLERGYGLVLRDTPASALDSAHAADEAACQT